MILFLAIMLINHSQPQFKIVEEALLKNPHPSMNKLHVCILKA